MVIAADAPAAVDRPGSEGMVQRRGLGAMLIHVGLAFGVAVMCFPIWIAFVASTLTPPQVVQAPMPLLPGDQMLVNYWAALSVGVNGVPVSAMMWNSLVMALGITLGKIAISLLSAYAIVYFKFPFRMAFFWVIFMTLMLPVEVRIVPTFTVIANFGMLNSHTGLILPLIASATATFLFRQVFLSVPDELAEAARIDGAGPIRFFVDILWPMSRTNVAALFVILFVYGWNQFLWPLLITTRPEMSTIVMGINRIIPRQDDVANWPLVMATAMLALLPPALVVLLMQNLFVKGLVEGEK
jgi:sn-glycerol 3-phosphate transport system permease protein